MNQFALVDCYSIYQTLKNKRKTDGIAIYVKSALTHEKEEIKLTDCNCYVVRIIKDNRKFTCISFYRSPNGKIDIFLQELKTVLQKYQDNNETNFIIGDMNIDTSISGNRSAKVEEYLHLLAEYGYICLVNKPTRVAKNSATCIDHIFSQFKRDEIYVPYVIQTNISDHFSTALSIQTNSIKEINHVHQYKEIIKINYENLVADIANENWDEVYRCDDPNLATSLFRNKIQKNLENNKSISYKKLEKS